MSAKLQLTSRRKAVLAVIRQAEKHLTAREIYDCVRQQLPSIAYGTVYNTLAYLHQASLIQVVHIEDGPTLYDRNVARHGHVACCQCGKVLDYSCPVLDQALEQAVQATGFRVEKAQVLFVGLCPECQSGKT